MPTPEHFAHAYPFRLVERVEAGAAGEYCVVLATAGGTLSAGEDWPVTLVAEALAQAILQVVPRPREGTPRLAGLDRVRLLQRVGAGARLEVEVREEGAYGTLRRFGCRAVSDGALAATAQVTVIG